MDDKTQITWRPPTPVPYFTASSYSTPRIRQAIWLHHSYTIQARTTYTRPCASMTLKKIFKLSYHFFKNFFCFSIIALLRHTNLLGLSCLRQKNNQRYSLN